MIIARVGITTVLHVCLIAGSLAAQRPDFSGRWTTAPATTPNAPGGGAAGGGGAGGGPARTRVFDLGTGWGPTITITQDATRMTVEYVYFARGDMQPPLRFVYALDGSETRNTVMMGRGVQEQLARATWTDNKLVITTQHPFTNPDNGQPMRMEVRRVLSLPTADSLVIETTRNGVLGGPSSTSRTVYHKTQS